MSFNLTFFKPYLLLEQGFLTLTTVITAFLWEAFLDSKDPRALPQTN